MATDDAAGKHPPAAVKKLRASLGMSQAVFAELLGVSAILVQSWERASEPHPPWAAGFGTRYAATPPAGSPASPQSPARRAG